MREIWVVADRFKGFAGQESVCTVSEVAALAATWTAEGERVTLRLGQGIGEYEHGYLHGTVSRLGLTGRVHLAGAPAAPAGRAVVHKHVPSNVLLADPVAEGDGVFVAGLRLAADNELLLDHQTGVHVQGMVVVEAIRQMFLAAFEIGYRHLFPERDYYAVWNGLDVEFRSFLFPLPALLRCTVESAALDDPRRLDFAAFVEVIQAGGTVAGARCRFTAFDAARICAVEHRRAQSAVAALADPAGAPVLSGVAS